MNFLGIDPGYALIGFGVVEKKTNKIRAIEYGTIQTPANLPIQDRIEMIYKEISCLIKKTTPSVIGIEKLFFAKNLKTAIDVSQARGVILLAAKQSKAIIYEFTPLQVKQGITGYGGATKQQIQKMLKQELGLSSIPKPDDAADALAIALCAAHSHRANNK